MNDTPTGQSPNDLPAIVRNLDNFYCHFCKRHPEHLEPRWTGHRIGGWCVRCGGRLGGNDRWLSRAKYGLQECKPAVKEDPSQGGLFSDGTGRG